MICLTSRLEEQEMEMDGGKVRRKREERSQTSAEDDRETWRNAATAPSLKSLDLPSLLLFLLVLTTSQRIPLADWHVGCISTRRGAVWVFSP